MPYSSIIYIYIYYRTIRLWGPQDNIMNPKPLSWGYLTSLTTTTSKGITNSEEHANMQKY